MNEKNMPDEVLMRMHDEAAAHANRTKSDDSPWKERYASFKAGKISEYQRARYSQQVQLKDGDKAVLDKQFNNASVVTVTRVGKHISTVSSKGASWDVVTGRLSAIMSDPEEFTASSGVPSIADYEEVLADHRRLVRELDVILNGDNAAQRASLVDIVGQLRNLWPAQREKLAAVQFKRNMAVESLKAKEKEITNLQIKVKELQEWHDSHM